MSRKLAIIVLFLSIHQLFSHNENNNKNSFSDQPKVIDLTELIKDNSSHQIPRDKLQELRFQLIASASKNARKSYREGLKSISLIPLSTGLFVVTTALRNITYLQSYCPIISLCGYALSALSCWEAFQSIYKSEKYSHKCLYKQAHYLLIEEELEHFYNDETDLH